MNISCKHDDIHHSAKYYQPDLSDIIHSQSILHKTNYHYLKKYIKVKTKSKI